MSELGELTHEEFPRAAEVRQLVEDGSIEAGLGLGCAALSFELITNGNPELGVAMLVGSLALSFKGVMKLGHASSIYRTFVSPPPIDSRKVSAS